MPPRRVPTGFVCPPDHPHEKNLNCHGRHKCECVPCVKGRSNYGKRRRIMSGKPAMIDSGPTMRKLQALARNGWGAPEVAAATGLDRSYLGAIRNGKRPTMRVATAAPIARLYAKHAMTIIEGDIADRSRRLAIKNGWHSPMRWADIDRGILG